MHVADRCSVLRLLDPTKLTGIFSAETDADLLSAIISSFHDRVCPPHVVPC